MFVDYLHVIKPSDNKIATKDAIDLHVRQFKKLSAEDDIPVFVISSFNRNNYLNVAAFEFFNGI